MNCNESKVAKYVFREKKCVSILQISQGTDT